VVLDCIDSYRNELLLFSRWNEDFVRASFSQTEVLAVLNGKVNNEMFLF
jgi:hypothetical protein